MSDPADAPRHGCLRAAIVAMLVLVAAVAGFALLLDQWHGEHVRFRARPPAVVGRAPIVGIPPGAIPISATVRTRVADSIVRVTGTACEELQQGSGFVVRPGYVVTDAHVVAGERSTYVIDHRGRRFDVTVVAFDGVRDLALLQIDSFFRARSLPPLSLAAPRAPADYAVFGHPGGGELRIAPAHLLPTGFVDAIGRDIYGRDIPGTRRLLALAARLAPGDSGAPVVDGLGRVVAVAFAIDPGGKPVAYALESREVDTMFGSLGALPAAVSTGPCISI